MFSLKKVLRCCVWAGGLFLMGLGISLVTKSNLGTSPISSLPYVLSLIYPMSFGQFTFLLSLMFFLIELLILRRKFPGEQYFQIGVGLFFGYFVDIGMIICKSIQPEYYGAKIVVLLLGCAVLAMGTYLQVAAQVVVNPGEGVVKTIAGKWKLKFGDVKIMLDTTLVVLAGGLSLMVLKSVEGLREGTVISAILVGAMIKGIDMIVKQVMCVAK